MKLAVESQMRGFNRCLAVITLLIVSTPSYALRCGHELVKEGDYKADVLDKCGDPDFFDSHYERRGSVVHGAVNQGINVGRGNQGYYGYPNSRFNYGQSHYREVEVLIEEWTYHFGRNRFNYLLTFENGRLKTVESIGRRRR